ncbi:MAG: hypothetical protein SP1CHLAM54_07820 [Chlamydiia bacterium]|nr:hypothetical protein [Chlamydiia bacterium]MCH9615688.1 hypothetical protein [Chlamydiia bacterium]MCH9628909.1 hypothetical protein [Chlamydiia bacterium]
MTTLPTSPNRAQEAFLEQHTPEKTKPETNKAAAFAALFFGLATLALVVASVTTTGAAHYATGGAGLGTAAAFFYSVYKSQGQSPAEEA